MDYYFLKETHSTINCEKKWKDEFGGDLHFSHGLSNSCGVLIAFYGNRDITAKNCPTKRTSPCFRCTYWQLWFFAYEYL